MGLVCGIDCTFVPFRIYAALRIFISALRKSLSSWMGVSGTVARRI